MLGDPVSSKATKMHFALSKSLLHPVPPSSTRQKRFCLCAKSYFGHSTAQKFSEAIFLFFVVMHLSHSRDYHRRDNIGSEKKFYDFTLERAYIFILRPLPETYRYFIRTTIVIPYSSSCARGFHARNNH